jgi:two-component system, LuxR family, response regulator FixJ
MNASVPSCVIRVVDDDDDFRPAISRLLRALGYSVRAYSSAAEYLRSPDDDARGCILLDVHMPGMSGLELPAILARSKNVLPIILMSGSGEVWDAAEMARTGAVCFLSKLADQRDLVKAVASALAADQPSQPDGGE